MSEDEIQMREYTRGGRDWGGLISRRRVLRGLTAGGTAATAGCGLFASDSSTSPNGGNPEMSGQTFRAPVEQNPSKASYHLGDLEAAFSVSPKEQVSGRLLKLVREPGVWGEKWLVGGEIRYTWLEDVTTKPTKVRVKISDDATWSDGRHITGPDIAVGVMDSYLRNPFPAYFASEKKDEPTIIRDAIDGFDISEKEVTYRSSPGYFEKWWDSTLKTSFGSGYETIPTHIKPYDAYADAVFETARLAIQGQINPWKGWANPYTKPNDPHKAELVEKYLANRGKFVAKFSKPENVVSTSAWDLVELEGPQAVFEPNTHHRNADTVNFGQVVLEYNDSDKRARAALEADRLDYAEPGRTPQAVTATLPDTITQLEIPSSGRNAGNELHLDFTHPALGKRKVRMALMYALDHSTVANNIHQSTAFPVTTPGGDCWDATDYVSKAWIDENLTTYAQDRERAASLMRNAGYTKDGEQWISAHGEPLTFQLPTPSGMPRWEPTVASQLTEFGIPTSVKTLDKKVFGQRKRGNEFTIWAQSGFVTSIVARLLAFWYGAATAQERFGIYPQEQFETGRFGTGISTAPVPRTEERYNDFSLKAPPIGQPDGPLKEYHPSAIGVGIFTHPPKPEFRRRVKVAMWLVNWVLPIIPINKTLKQHFIDDTHWQWPTDTASWQTFTNGGSRAIEGIFASGTLRANPDNPEK